MPSRDASPLLMRLAFKQGLPAAAWIGRSQVLIMWMA